MYDSVFLLYNSHQILDPRMVKRVEHIQDRFGKVCDSAPSEIHSEALSYSLFYRVYEHKQTTKKNSESMVGLHLVCIL